MNKAVEFIGTRGLYFLTTIRDNKPRVRPFGFCYDYQGKFLIPTENKKNCYLEMKENPHVELCACHEDDWLRVSGTVKEVKDPQIYDSFFENVPLMNEFFQKDDPNFVIFEMEGTALLFHNETLLEKFDF